MDKYDFIKRLDNALSPLSETERESALRYYKELFEDAENESELIEHLGSPEKIAENIIRESGMIKNQDKESENFKNTSDSDIPEWKKILNKMDQLFAYLEKYISDQKLELKDIKDVSTPKRLNSFKAFCAHFPLSLNEEAYLVITFNDERFTKNIADIETCKGIVRDTIRQNFPG